MTEIILTEDGSHTLFVPELSEHYHSIHGAVQESQFIFINSGLKHTDLSPVRIFEAGFGTGLNAYLSAIESSSANRKIFYTSIEKYPLPAEITGRLNYSGLFPGAKDGLFSNIHSCPWNMPVDITGTFTLTKIEGDLTKTAPEGRYDLIFFDAFGPDKQPEMWTGEVFERISAITETGGVFVTYSAKGSVQRSLKKAGFDVSLLPGPPGKRQIIRAVKI
ncbi:MAG: tRNA (5-methylaminomethyl-2-thiouridine)(34)-methyltransferase MnmD [Bacteroidales bacterium]|jgi:tRNA U34 5-methylaminomethyl-2-thiouridine-forming methyltransferase MnmC|nr:tRNA (5-methylaminomethyl-2-thiouridine)(34)-methyltransferase MnmD [Bacteroidales bacterium]